MLFTLRLYVPRFISACSTNEVTGLFTGSIDPKPRVSASVTAASMPAVIKLQLQCANKHNPLMKLVG